MKKPNLKSNKLSIVNDTPEPTPKQKIEAIAPSENGKKSNKKTVPEEELVHNALQDLKEGIVQKPKDYIYSDEEKRKIKERKKEAPKTGSRIYSIPNQEQMQGAPTNKLTGQIPNTVNVYGAHYPVVRVLNDGNTILLHTSDYGQSGKTTQLVGKVKNDLPNIFPDAHIIQIHHPDYRHSAKVMRIRDENNVHKYLEDASQNHPDENYRQHALESLEHLRGIKKAEYSKPIHAKRTEGEGWDYNKNVQRRLDRLHQYLSKVGLTVDLDSEDGRKIGATSPSSIGINKEGDPYDQQVLHEAGHAMLAPEGMTLGGYQAFIGKPGNDAKHQASAYREEMQVIHGGGMPEQTAQHMEAGIARRAGIEPFRTPKRGVGAGTAEEMSRKHAARILDLHDEGILSVDPFTGEKEIGTGIDALINAKARAQKSGEKAEMNRNPEDFPSTLNRRQLKSSLKDNAKYTEENAEYRKAVQPRLDTVAFHEADLRDKIREKFKQHTGGHRDLEESLAASENTKPDLKKSILEEMFEVLLIENNNNLKDKTSTIEDPIEASYVLRKQDDIKKNAPRIKVSNQKGLSSRPDQEVYPADMWSGKSKISPITGQPWSDYLHEKIKTSGQSEKYQRPMKTDESKGIAEELKTKNAGLGGIFIPSKKKDIAIAGKGSDDYVKEHEGFHLLSEQIRQKYGEDEHTKFLDSLINKIHPKAVNDINNTLLQTDSYKRMASHDNPRYKNAYKEEMLNLVRDWSTKGKRRDRLKSHFKLDANGKSIENNPWHENQFKDFDGRIKNSWKNIVNHSKNYKFNENKAQTEDLAASENQESDLKKINSNKVLTEEELPKIKKPFRSKRQRRFLYSHPEKIGGKEALKEWESKTPKNIPESVKKKDIIPGGLATRKKPSQFNKKKLKEGAKVEMEHTNDKKIAQEIAMDHLTEDKNYYKKLKTVEKFELPKSLKTAALTTALASAGHEMVEDRRSKPETRQPASQEKVLSPQEQSYQSAYNEGMKIGYLKDFEKKPSNVVVKETIKNHPDLSESHGYMLKLSPNAFKEVVQNNQPLVREVGSRHYDRLFKIFGGDQDKIRQAWQGSVKATRRRPEDDM